MPRVRIIKKNDEYSSEYDLGDIFEITGTWYGGVHIEGKSGVPVSLDKDEYMELDTEPQEQKNPAVGEVPERDILVGDIVQHFKREWVSSETSEYLYKVLHLRSIRRRERSWSFIRGCIRRSRYVPDRMICL